MAHVLLVEDEDDIALALRIILRSRGHETTHVSEGLTAMAEVVASPPALVVLDIGLPDVDGWTVLAGIRTHSWVPVLLLTAAGTDEDKVRGLLGGADDYLTKPFSATVLGDRVDRLLARSEQSGRADLVWGDVTVSPADLQVTVAGAPVDLATFEMRLLATFLRHPGQVVDDAFILDALWGEEPVTGGHVASGVQRLLPVLGWEGPEGPLRAVGNSAWRLGPPT